MDIQINPLRKYTNRLNRKRILPGSNMQVRFDCTSWSSREGVSQTIITTRVHKWATKINWIGNYKKKCTSQLYFLFYHFLFSKVNTKDNYKTPSWEALAYRITHWVPRGESRNNWRKNSRRESSRELHPLWVSHTQLSTLCKDQFSKQTMIYYLGDSSNGWNWDENCNITKLH